MLRIAQVWAGAMDVMPVTGVVAQLPGRYLATGYAGHGFGIAPGAGHLQADLISGRNRWWIGSRFAACVWRAEQLADRAR